MSTAGSTHAPLISILGAAHRHVNEPAVLAHVYRSAQTPSPLHSSTSSQPASRPSGTRYPSAHPLQPSGVASMQPVPSAHASEHPARRESVSQHGQRWAHPTPRGISAPLPCFQRVLIAGALGWALCGQRTFALVRSRKVDAEIIRPAQRLCCAALVNICKAWRQRAE